MTIKFLKHELKKSLWPTILLTIIGSLIYIPVLVKSNFNYYIINQMIIVPSPKINIIVIFLCVICTIVPVYEYSFLMKKRSVDQYYSLPIKRSSIIVTKFLCGYFKIIVSYTITFFLGLLVISLKENSYFLKYYFMFYFYTILLALILYAFYSFVFSRANTIVDGIIFIILYTLIFSLVEMNIKAFFRDVFNVIILRTNALDFPYSPLNNITRYYDGYIRYGYSSVIEKYWVSYLLWSIVGFASMLGLIYSSKLVKVEKAEQISDSYFGYRILIPLYLVSILYSINPFSNRIDIVSSAVFLCAGLIGYIVYRRTLKLQVKYWLILIGSFIFSLLLIIIF